MWEDGPDVERVRRIVDALLPAYVDPEQVRVYVIENREWNAFAMGNFSIYVFSGLLDDMDDDELAIVLGHELAHATHEHTRRQFKKAMWVQLAAIGISAAAEDIDDKTARRITQLLVLFGAAAWQNGYGRDLEDQADRVGLRYAYEAGYDISKGPRLWRRFARRYGEPGKVANFFLGNHSLASQRAANLEKQIALNYPDGPRDTGVRLAVAAKTLAAGRSDTLPAAAGTAAVPPGAAALAGSAGGDTKIRPGMSADEVLELAGRPTREVSLGSRGRWVYPYFTVVFEDGRVAEVKF
jgi:predicted Zn-dependent protease